MVVNVGGTELSALTLIRFVTGPWCPTTLSCMTGIVPLMRRSSTGAHDVERSVHSRPEKETGMKMTMCTCAWMLLALCLCSCDHEADGVSEPVTVDIVATSAEYAGPYAHPEPGPMEYDLAVMVQSNTGLPLAGALVKLAVDDGDGTTIQQVNTDEWGLAYFYFYAQPGTWVFIDACSTGLACSAVDLLTGGDQVVDVPIYLAPLVVGVQP